jgi:hypothetical protein
VIILFEGGPGAEWIGDTSDKRENRRLKLERAIAKREALLREISQGKLV